MSTVPLQRLPSSQPCSSNAASAATIPISPFALRTSAAIDRGVRKICARCHGNGRAQPPAKSQPTMAACRCRRCSHSLIPSGSRRAAASAAASCWPTAAPASSIRPIRSPRAPYLVVAELQGRAAATRIVLAVATDETEVATFAADSIETGDEIVFDSEARAVRARRVRRLGAIEAAQRIAAGSRR